jgi:hypothetical protein
MEERVMSQQKPITHTKDIGPIRCPHCNEKAHLVRRTPDAFNRDGSGVWTFQCINGHNTSKSDQQ